MTNKRKITFQDIVEIEKKTSTTISELYNPSFYATYNLGIEILLQLNYFFPSQPTAEERTIEQEYFVFCHHRFLQIPYTFRAIMLLANRGYYFEALPLCRNLLEVLVKMHYLKNHHEYIEKISRGDPVKFINQRGKTQNLLIKDIFNEVNPGLYSVYGDILSHLQHGGIAVLNFRAKEITPEGGKVIIGPQYSSKYLSYVCNTASMLMLCYLKNFENFSGQKIDGIERDVFIKYDHTLEQLINLFKDLIVRKPSLKNWITKFDGLIDSQKTFG